MNMHCAKLPILREFKKNDFLLKLLVLLVVLFTCSKSFPLYSQQIKTVVIDAGHGGKDPGCHGNFAFEKEVCLSMALKLGSLIKAKYPEIKIIYTRDKDVFVEGTETYVLGLHRTEAQQRVAERENSIIALEDDKGAKYKEIDLSTDAIIVRQLQLKVFLDHSILFAEKLQKAFKKFGRYDRGVKQAGFLVLYKTTMPSVLIETGFLTNPNEEKFLGNITGQVNMADLMFNAFENYRNQIENKTPVIIEKNDEIISEPVESPESTLKDSSGLVFRVQVETWDKRRDNSYNLFKGYEVFEYEQDKMYKYCIGNFSDYQMAKNYKIELIKKGFQNAFLVAFLNGERISIEKAIKLAEK
ncbi:MAG: N-acetylmuramoyl-L-alanine amidase [Flavobacteriia bacterium]|nr:N-acetylmuramoyl-L-alanine amidase [Flavobacteriia bacterium]